MSAEKELNFWLVSGIFALSFALVYFAFEHQQKYTALAKAQAYQTWSKHELFLNSLERYNHVYRGLQAPDDKAALALGYVKMVTDDLFLMPSKRAEQVTLNVILPATDSEIPKPLAAKPYVMQQIYIGEDNGLYDALRFMLKGASFTPYARTPIWFPGSEQLLTYIKSGDVTALNNIKSERFGGNQYFHRLLVNNHLSTIREK